MFQADKDKDDAITYEEYKAFAKYYSSQLGSVDSQISDNLKDLFDTLVEKSGADAGSDAISVYGCNPQDTITIDSDRVDVLRAMCEFIEGCICCGVCVNV